MFNYDESAFAPREHRIIDIWSSIYNAFNSIDFVEGLWKVSGPDYDMNFSSKEMLIDYLENDVKESLLSYAIMGELSEIASHIEKGFESELPEKVINEPIDDNYVYILGQDHDWWIYDNDTDRYAPTYTYGQEEEEVRKAVNNGKIDLEWIDSDEIDFDI